MKNSGTSTSKKVNNKSNIRRKTSTSPSNVKHKKTTNVSNNTKNVVNSKRKNINTTKNNSSNYIPLNKTVYNDNIKFEDYYDEYYDEPQSKKQGNFKPQKVDKKEYNTKSKKKSFFILKLVFLIGILIALGYLAFNLEYFNLSDISVKGNIIYDSSTIISNSDLKVGKNIFMQLVMNENKKINLPYISKYKYNYKFPNSIVIEVTERYPAYIALDRSTGKYYKIDNEGYLLEECKLEDKDTETLVEGMVFGENVEYGKKINDVYIEKIQTYNRIKELLSLNELPGEISKVNFSNSLTIITLNDKLNIVFANNSDLEYKVSFLKGIIEQIGGIAEGTINMSIENPVFSQYD